MENVKWGCEKCHAPFELSTKRGRTAAKYGKCPKCLCEDVMNFYKKSKFGIFKITGAIPFLAIWLGYRHFYGKKEV